MKIYTIIGGVNGVGKSSLTGVLTSENNYLGIIIDADKITAALGSGKINGSKKAIENINNCLKMGLNFTQETTLSGVRTLKTIKKPENKLLYKTLLCKCRFCRSRYS